MLKRIEPTIGFKIKAQDGEIGDVEDYLFDEEAWTIRYLVADTGGWLSDQLVLVSPHKLGQPDWEEKLMPVKLTVQAVEQSPPIESDLPVSRRSEIMLAQYYGWTPYWAGGELPGDIAMSVGAEADVKSREAAESHTDSHLHGVKEVTGYHTRATDGDIGHVQDFIVDTETWAIRYLLLDTRNWLPGKHVLIPPSWASDVDWAEERVHVNVDRDAIRNAPPFDASTPITREEEVAYFKHFDKTPYWEA
jgi:uncharacterized protein YrrD